LAESRGADFDPLVTLGQRKAWEAYACSQTKKGLLGKVDSLTKRSSPTARVVCDGIYNQTVHGPVNDTGYNYGALQPTWMFPVWQICPIQFEAPAVMHNPYPMNPSRKALYDRIITTKGPGFSDLLKLLQDKTSMPVPSTLLMTPITRLNDSAIVGIFTQLFSWDLFFRKSLPDYIKKIHLILKTKTKTFTIEIGNGQVYVQTQLADGHDTHFDSYRRDITSRLPTFFTSGYAGYQITMYPTAELYDHIITDLPRNVTIAVVFLIFFVVLVFGAYDYLVNRREKKLIAREERAVENEEKVRDLLPHFLSPAEQHAGGVTSRTVADVLHLYPVHQALLERKGTAEVLAVLAKHGASARERLDGRTGQIASVSPSFPSVHSVLILISHPIPSHHIHNDIAHPTALHHPTPTTPHPIPQRWTWPSPRTPSKTTSASSAPFSATACPSAPPSRRERWPPSYPPSTTDTRGPRSSNTTASRASSRTF
jgi:hypothetical protein